MTRFSETDLAEYRRRHPGLFSETAENEPLTQAMGIPEWSPTSPLPPKKPVQRGRKQPSGRISAEALHDSSTQTEVRLTLPYPPSLNSIWRAVVVRVAPKPVARVLLSERGRRYRRAVIAQVRGQGRPRMPSGARLALVLEVCPPDRRVRDLSNLPKALEDALTHAGVWADDSLIDELHVYRRPPRKPASVDVTITVLPHLHKVPQVRP